MSKETDAARLTIEERQRFARGDGVLYELVPARFARELEAERDRLRGDNDRLREIMRMVADSTAATWVCDELRKALEVKP